MTKEEAIKVITDYLNKDTAISPYNSRFLNALYTAIEALKEPKTIIGIDIPYGSDKGMATLFKGKDDKLVLEEVKEIMAVVRCKDCQFSETYQTDSSGAMALYCKAFTFQRIVTGEDFCSYGERSKNGGKE